MSGSASPGGLASDRRDATQRKAFTRWVQSILGEDLDERHRNKDELPPFDDGIVLCRLVVKLSGRKFRYMPDPPGAIVRRENISLALDCLRSEGVK